MKVEENDTKSIKVKTIQNDLKQKSFKTRYSFYNIFSLILKGMDKLVAVKVKDILILFK